MKKFIEKKQSKILKNVTKVDGVISYAEIAREAGVSAGVVSAFFNGNHYSSERRSGIGISQSTRVGIIETCHRLNYIPDNPLGLFLLYPEKADVGYMLSDVIGDGFANPYHSLMFEGFAKRAFEAGVDLSNVFFRADHDYLLNPESLPNSIQRGSIRKVAVAGGAPNYSLIHCLLKIGAVVVLMGAALPVRGVVSVVPDFAEAGRLAICKLHESGHRRIAVVGNASVPRSRYNGKLLWSGCMKAMRELGLTENEVGFVQQPGPADPALHLVPVSDLVMSLEPRPTAVFCLDDGLARAMVHGLAAVGLSIPDDISILGCNDDRINQEMRPGLSTIHLPCRQIGHRAFEELTRIAVNGVPDVEEQIVLPVRFVDHGSIRQLSS